MTKNSSIIRPPAAELGSPLGIPTGLVGAVELEPPCLGAAGVLEELANALRMLEKLFQALRKRLIV